MLLFLIFVIAFSAYRPLLWADQSGGYYVPSPAEVVSPKTSNLDQPDEGLVDASLQTPQNRFAALERRILDLEKENRFQDEKIRSLDRTVDDIKRRNLR